MNVQLRCGHFVKLYRVWEGAAFCHVCHAIVSCSWWGFARNEL
jgi:hypothetical protein